MNTTVRESYVDVVRGLAIILVVLGHLGIPFPMHSFIYGFHMPLFFILSGYLYSSSKWSGTAFLQFTHIKARTYLLPYAILSFVNLLTNLLIEFMQFSSAELLASTKSHLCWLLLSNNVYGSAPNCEALWFLPCFFLCTIGFHIIEKQSTIMRSVLLLLLFLLQIYFIDAAIQLPWHINILPLCILFMFTGLFVRKSGAVNRPFFALAASLCIGIAGILLNPIVFDMNHMSFGNLPLALCGTVGMSYTLLYICKHWLKRSSLLELFGRNTLLIMGLHMLINSIILLLLNRIPLFSTYGYHWWMNAILLLLLLIPICLCWERIRKKCRHRK